MATSQFNIQGLIQNLVSGLKKIGPVVIANSNNIGVITWVAMGTTISPAAIAVPSGAIACLIVPPVNNVATITMKTSLNSGDTGLPIAPSVASLIAFAATAPTTMTFVLGATVANANIELNFV